MATLQVGLLGCGSFGKKLAAHVNELHDARISAVYNRTFSEAEAVGKDLRVPAFSAYEELVQQDYVDAVVIATSHDTHKPMALAAAAAGKHIFCEKAMALTVAECRAMIHAAQKNNVKLMVGHVTRLLPLFSRVKEIIDGGEIGRTAAVSMIRYWPVIRRRWWARKSQIGGLLHSPAVHEIDYLNFLCGNATSVYAVAGPQIQQETDYEDTMQVIVRYENGACGSVATSISSTLTVQEGWVIGEHGGLHYDMYGPDEEGIIEYQAAGGDLRKETVELKREVVGELGLSVGIRREVRNFVDWILRDAEPLLTAQAGLRAVEICEAAYRSVSEGKPIAVPLP